MNVHICYVYKGEDTNEATSLTYSAQVMHFFIYNLFHYLIFLELIILMLSYPGDFV